MTTNGAAISRVLGRGGFYVSQTGFDRQGIFAHGRGVGHGFVDVFYIGDEDRALRVTQQIADFLTGKGYQVTVGKAGTSLVVRKERS